MRKDTAYQKNRCKKRGWSYVSKQKLLLCDSNLIFTEYFLIFIKIWEDYYLYAFLYLQNCDVQWPNSLTYLEGHMWSFPFSASSLSDFLSFPLSHCTPATLASLLVHGRTKMPHLGAFTLEVLCLKLALLLTCLNG